MDSSPAPAARTQNRALSSSRRSSRLPKRSRSRRTLIRRSRRSYTRTGRTCALAGTVPTALTTTATSNPEPCILSPHSYKDGNHKPEMAVALSEFEVRRHCQRCAAFPRCRALSVPGGKCPAKPDFPLLSPLRNPHQALVGFVDSRELAGALAAHSLRRNQQHIPPFRSETLCNADNHLLTSPPNPTLGYPQAPSSPTQSSAPPWATRSPPRASRPPPARLPAAPSGPPSLRS